MRITDGYKQINPQQKEQTPRQKETEVFKLKTFTDILNEAFDKVLKSSSNEPIKGLSIESITVEKNDAIHNYIADASHETEHSKKIIKDPWKQEFSNYRHKNSAKYNKVLKYVERKNKQDATEITNMVYTLSDRYGIDAEIIAAILDHETGGFVFNEQTMNPLTKKYKGVMQVGPDVIKSMYANPEDAKNMKLSYKERCIAYDNKHYKKDKKKIEELKKKYPTPESLYNAIKTDVALGLEVGIIAYKGDLSMHKGNVKKALAKYCGKQYKLPANTSAKLQYNNIPEYNKDII